MTHITNKEAKAIRALKALAKDWLVVPYSVVSSADLSLRDQLDPISERAVARADVIGLVEALDLIGIEVTDHNAVDLRELAARPGVEEPIGLDVVRYSLHRG